MTAEPAFVALALTPPEADAVREALGVLSAREPERQAARAVLEMLERPLAPGELRLAFGEGESFEPGHEFAAPRLQANGAGLA